MGGKLPSDDILIIAIRNLDSNKLSLDGVSKLVSIHKLHSNEVILDKPEIWCLMIDGFPMIKHGLMCWEFMLKIEDSLKSITESINTVPLVCKELRTSITINCLFSPTSIAMVIAIAIAIAISIAIAIVIVIIEIVIVINNSNK
ncbi:hypothetical protein ACTFIZ_000604 [Dictyostelium cf. discoideum]